MYNYRDFREAIEDMSEDRLLVNEMNELNLTFIRSRYEGDKYIEEYMEEIGLSIDEDSKEIRFTLVEKYREK